MFYENFERVCKERKTTPSRACIDAGMGKNRASNWKTNGTLPKQDELEKLARVLRCDVADFFRSNTAPKFHTAQDAIEYYTQMDMLENGEDPIEYEERTLKVKPDTYEEDVIKAMRRMTKRQQNEFMSLVYQFIDSIGIPSGDLQ